MFHVEMEQRSARFNPETGKKNHKSFVQKFHPRDFALQISTNDRKEPVYATVGWRINKILHVPSEKALDGVQVNTVVDRKVVRVPITEALDAIREIIKAQDAVAKS